MSSGTPNSRTGVSRPPVSPRRSAAPDATGPSPRSSTATQHHRLRMAIALNRANGLQHARMCYDTWRSYVRKQQQMVHLKRCSVALKHSTNRNQYAKLFIRWLTAVQQSAMQELKITYKPPMEYPLCTKRDVLGLVSRYFAKWRRHLRESQQRTVANVAAIEQVNEQRLQSRAFTRWLLFRQEMRETAQEEQGQEAENRIASLEADLKEREEEVALLQGAVIAATEAIGGQKSRSKRRSNSNGRKKSQGRDSHSPTQSSMECTKALVDDLQDALDGICGAKETGSPCETVSARLDALEGVNDAHQKAKEQLQTVNELLEALLQMVTGEPAATDAAASLADSEMFSAVQSQRRGSIASSSPHRKGSLGNSLGGIPVTSPLSPPATHPLGGTRRSSISPPSSLIRSQPRQLSGNASALSPYVIAQAAATKAAQTLTEQGNPTPQKLLEGTMAIVASGKDSTEDLDRRAEEVTMLRDAALRAIDALGGRGATHDPSFTAGASETPNDSAKRSRAVAESLGELCEDMVVVLVLTSLWSQDGASEKVSESLERMWNALRHAEEDLTAAQQTETDLIDVMKGATRLLADDGDAADDSVSRAKELAVALEKSHKETTPQQLIEKCEGVITVRQTADTQAAAAEEERKLRASAEEHLADLNNALAAAQDDVKQAAEELNNTKEQLAEVEAERQALADNLERLEEELAATKEKAQQDGASSGQQLEEAQHKIEEVEAERQALADNLERLEEELAATKEKAQQDGASSGQQLEEAQHKIEEVEAERQALADNLERLEEELAATKEKAQQDGASSGQQLEEAQHKIEEVEAERQALADNLERLEEELAATKEKAQQDGASSGQQLEEAQHKIEEVEAERQALADNLERLEEELAATKEKAQQDGASSGQQLEEAQHKIEAAKREQEEIEAKVKGVNDAFGALEDLLAPGDAPATPGDLREAGDALAQAATVAEEAGLPGPARCIRAVGKVTAKVADALQTAPETVQQARTTAGPSLEGQVGALVAWKDELEEAKRNAEVAGLDSSSLAAFLRDVIRDIIHRLVVLRENCAGEDSMQCTRVSLALDPEEAPVPLVRGDPSQYVEYILHFDGIDEQGKRAVQDHLKKAAVVGCRSGGGGTPCTWDVIADIHENVVALVGFTARQTEALVEQKELYDELTHEHGTLREAVESAQNALQHWSAVDLPVVDHTAPQSRVDTPALPGDSFVHGFSTDVEAVVAALQQLKGLVDGEMGSCLSGTTATPAASGNGVRDTVSLVAALTDMNKRLTDLENTAEDGILALGGSVEPATADGDAASNGGSMEHSFGPGPARHLVIKQRLADICQETGVSLQETVQILGVFGVSGEPYSLKDILPNIRSKIEELEEVRKDSEALVRGLDNAFNDEWNSSTTSSVTSATRRRKSLKAKKKPLPAIEGSPSQFMLLTHKETSKRAAAAASLTNDENLSPQERLSAIRSHALGKIDEVHSLRKACEMAISLLDGSYVEGGKAPAYGDVLVPLLLSQLEDLKKSLPECDEVLGGRRGSASVRKVGVGAKLSQLVSLAAALKLERDNLRDELNRRQRQNVILLDDIEKQTEGHTKTVDNSRERLKALQEEVADLEKAKKDLDERLREADEKAAESETAAKNAETYAAELADRLANETDEINSLAQRVAQRQHDNNVLTTALATMLSSLAPASPTATPGSRSTPQGKGSHVYGSFNDESTYPPTTVELEPIILQKLASDEGDILLACVADAIDAINQGHQSSLSNVRSELQELRDAMEQLRGEVTGAWDHGMRALCEELLVGVADEIELMRVENDMLRPRAVEREVLLRENEQLHAALAHAQEEADTNVEENMQLRRALREAEVERVLWAIPNQPQVPPPPSHGVDIAELERRMIRGATTLTVEAIDSIAGQNMAHVLGDIAAQAVRFFNAVDHCAVQLQESLNAFNASQDQHRLVVAVRKGSNELEKLAVTADELSAAIPELFHPPYMSRS